jgi:hypothetical protein
MGLLMEIGHTVVMVIVVIMLFLITATAAARVGFTRRAAVVTLNLSLLTFLVLLGLGNTDVGVDNHRTLLDILEAAASLLVADESDNSARAAVGEKNSKDHTAHKTTLTTSVLVDTLVVGVEAGVTVDVLLFVETVMVIGVLAGHTLIGTSGVGGSTSVVIVAHSWLQVGVARGAGTASAARSTAAVGVSATLQVGALRRGVGQRFNLIVLGVSALVVLPGVVGEVHAAQL